MTVHTEQAFEDAIEASLLGVRWQRGQRDGYDRELGLDTDQLCTFTGATRSEVWERSASSPAMPRRSTNAVRWTCREPVFDGPGADGGAGNLPAAPARYGPGPADADRGLPCSAGSPGEALEQLRAVLAGKLRQHGAVPMRWSSCGSGRPGCGRRRASAGDVRGAASQVRSILADLEPADPRVPALNSIPARYTR